MTTETEKMAAREQRINRFKNASAKELRLWFAFKRKGMGQVEAWQATLDHIAGVKKEKRPVVEPEPISPLVFKTLSRHARRTILAKERKAKKNG